MIDSSLRVILTLGIALASSAAARADMFYNQWNYAIDSFSDGSGADYELYGLAFRQIGDVGYFAISSRMPREGNYSSNVSDRNVGYGDLFLNFSSHDLDTSSEFNDPKVVAIRFAGNNDSLGGNSSATGVYKNVTVVSLSSANGGYSTLDDYYDDDWDHRPGSGAMGDLEKTSDVIEYLGDGTMYTNISSGTKVGEINLLSRSALAALGLDFDHFNSDPSGSNVFGFSFSLSGLPTGNFTAHLFEECINDGVALEGSVPTGSSVVPEPTSLALAGFAGIGLALRALRRRKNATADQAA